MRPVVLVVMDGIGIAPEGEGNAVSRAETPTLDQVFETYPYTELDAAGEAVGLPAGYIGNSEVGHLHIGAGRTIPQELVRVNTAIEDGTFFDNEVLAQAAAQAREHDSLVHLMGIVSDGGVHGHIDHIIAMMQYFAEKNLPVLVHAFLDGRDVSPKSAEQYLSRLEEAAARYGTGHVASFMGRFYAMDRDENWDRTQQAYDALVNGKARTTGDLQTGLHEAYSSDRNDYFIKPTVVEDIFEPVSNNDVVVCSNYRKDRARQLTAAFVDETFEEFPVMGEPPLFISLFRYRDDFNNAVLFEHEEVRDTLGDIIARNGGKQLRLSESQKQPHVTYFLNGQKEADLPGEDVTIFKSAAVAAYDEKPEMEAEQITDYAVDAMDQKRYEFIFINYPNADLVGHTADIAAAVQAVETVDTAVARLEKAAVENGYSLVLTSDHGNCETLLDETGAPHTAHTLNRVPFCIVDDQLNGNELKSGGLTNIAATVLELLDIEPVPEMDPSLL